MKEKSIFNNHNHGKNQKHSHSHHFHDYKNLKNKNLVKVVILNFFITLVEIIGGLFSNSLSLLSDAVHNLGDSSAIFIAFLAGKKSHKSPNKQYTFGYKRIEILAALFNAIVLIIICIFLFYEAYLRFIEPQTIKGLLMFWVAIFGLIANLISVLLLHKDKEHNLNIKSAYLHLMGDTLSSIAVIVGAIAIWKFNVVWIDPLITVMVGIYILYHTWDIVKQTFDILMQSSPVNIDVENIKKMVEKIDKVENIHHIHIWQLDDVTTHLEAHINLSENMDMLTMMKVKQTIEELLIHNFNISHTTLQIGFICCDGDSNLIKIK